MRNNNKISESGPKIEILVGQNNNLQILITDNKFVIELLNRKVKNEPVDISGIIKKLSEKIAKLEREKLDLINNINKSSEEDKIGTRNVMEICIDNSRLIKENKGLKEEIRKISDLRNNQNKNQGINVSDVGHNNILAPSNFNYHNIGEFEDKGRL